MAFQSTNPTVCTVPSAGTAPPQQMRAASNDNTDLRIAVSINPDIIDKNFTGNTLAYSGPWLAKHLTVTELADHITQGHAFSVHYKNEHRKGVNFLRAGFLALDFDGTMTLDEARANDFITTYGGLLYTTPRHGVDGKDRFRVVFPSPREITKGKDWANALYGLAVKLGSDTSATDSARLFYGSRGCQVHFLKHTLSETVLDELIEAGTRIALEAKKQRKRATGTGLVGASETAREFIPPNLILHTDGGGQFTIESAPAGMRVLCPFHDDDSASAFIVESKKGSRGVHCSACKSTWWQGRTVPIYNYFSFEERAVQEKLEDPAQDGGTEFRPLIEIINERYLPKVSPRPGVTFVKSPKGTGKTRQIQYIVQQAKMRGQSILLIGHRRTLIRELSGRLGLGCYLDDEIPRLSKHQKAKMFQRPNEYAVSVDSLPIRLWQPRPYSVVIVDECEQVFSHAVSGTIKQPQLVLNRLIHYVNNAEFLYLFDADLNEVTNGFVTACRKKLPPYQTRIVINQYKEADRPYDLFASRDDLVRDMMASLDSGKRIFVACNSRKKAESIAAVLAKRPNNGAKIMLVTAETKPEKNVTDFLANITTEILLYDATIASPAIGTGIDISFPGAASKIDVVYGLFEAGINSHYDIDQQIGRVRNPGELKVWIAPQHLWYEINPETVLSDIVESGDAQYLLEGFTKKGEHIYDREHPVLKLYAEVYCAQRGSQNALRDLFVKHRERNGWFARDVEKQESGTADLKKIEQQVAAERIKAIVAAAKLGWDEYENLKIAQEQGESVGSNALLAMQRFEIEDFYGQEISPVLIELDKNGAFRPRVERFALIQACTGKYVRILDVWDQYVASGMIGKAFAKSPARLVVGAICAAGLFHPDGRLDTERRITMNDLAPFIDFCKKQQLTLQRDLSVLLKGNFEKSPIKTLNTLLSFAGLKTELVQKTKKNGRKIYLYALSASDIAQMKEICAMRTCAGMKKGGRIIRSYKRKLVSKRPKDTLDFLFEDTAADDMERG